MTWSRVRLHLSNILQFLCNASKRVKKCVIIVIYCRPFIFYVHSTSSEQLDTNNSHSCNFFFFKLARCDTPNDFQEEDGVLLSNSFIFYLPGTQYSDVIA